MAQKFVMVVVVAAVDDEMEAEVIANDIRASLLDNDATLPDSAWGPDMATVADAYGGVYDDFELFDMNDLKAD